MQAPQLGARLDADLLDKRAPGRPVSLERVGLAPAAVQREHELSAQTLAQRMQRDQLPQLGHELAVRSDREIRFDAQLERGLALLVEAGDGGLRERCERELRQRRAAPHRECVAQHRPRTARLARRQRAPRLPHYRLESLGIQLTGHDPQPIASRRRAQDAGIPERPPQPGHMHLDGLGPTGRRILPPQSDGQTVRAHRLVGMQDEHRQRRANLPTGDGYQSRSGTDLQWPENTKLHGARREATSADELIHPRSPRCPSVAPSDIAGGPIRL